MNTSNHEQVTDYSIIDHYIYSSYSSSKNVSYFLFYFFEKEKCKLVLDT